MIVPAEFRQQGERWDFISGQGDPDQHRHRQQIEKLHGSAGLGWVPQQQPRDRDRKGRTIKPGVATSDRASGPVRHLADQGIDESIDEQGDGNCQADDISAHADNLIIIIKQENRKAAILDPVS